MKLYALAVLLIIVVSAPGTTVTWSSELLASNGSNVSASGVEHVGVSYGSGSGDSRIINGVNFKANETAWNHENPNWSGWIDNRNASATRYGAAGTDLKELTNDIVYGQTLVLGIRNLVVGNRYRIQLISYDASNWWNNSEASIERWQTIAAPQDTAYNFQHGTQSPYANINGVGAVLVIGTWTADAREIAFTIAARGPNDNAIINGFVVQDITETLDITPELPNCLASASDKNLDCVVDIVDLMSLAAKWLDQDISVNLSDFSRLAEDWLQSGSSVIISEFMANNKNTLVDNFGVPSDWIELKNLGDTPQNLQGWHLTNDQELLNKWTFPAVEISSKGHLVVFASGRDLSGDLSYLHTNFQLDNDRGYLALVRPDLSIAHEFKPHYPVQAEDVSCGLTMTIGSDRLTTGHFLYPSPGTDNGVAVIGPAEAGIVKWSCELLAPDGGNVLAVGAEHVGVSYGSAPGDSRMINGVNFKANDTAGNHTNPNWSGWIDDRNGSATRYGAAGTDLKELTNDIVYGDTLVLRINNLTIGHTYRIQLISYDAGNWWSSSETASERWQTIAVTGGTAFSFQHGTESPYAGINDVGAALVIGTWTADAAEIEFTIKANGSDNAIINAFIVQDVVPGPGSMHGYNWADPRDNANTGWVMPSGLHYGISDAAIDALGERVCNAFQKDGKGNTIRFGINPRTVANAYWWDRYQRLIAKCQSKGFLVILCCWDSPGYDGIIDDYSLWRTMWQTLDAAYAYDGTIFFEPFNEAHGYSQNDWLNIAQDFTNFTRKPENRILIGGTGYSERVSAIGGDPRVGNCWLSLHVYAWWGSFQSESLWQWMLSGQVGSYWDKTVLTEFGVPATTGKDYSTPSSDYEVCFMRGVCRKLNEQGMGCCYWIGIKDGGDTYKLFTTQAAPEITNWSLAHELYRAFGYYD